jgi:hypothetical protein
MSVDASFQVEPAAAIVSRFGSRRKLRSVWHQLLDGYQVSVKELEPIANKLGVCAYWLRTELDRPQTFGRLFEQVTQYQHQNSPMHWQPIDIKAAIIELREQLALLNDRAPSDKIAT